MTLRRRFTPLFLFDPNTPAGGTPAAPAAPATPAPAADPAPAAEPAAPALTAEQQAAVNAEVARQLSGEVAPKVAAALQKQAADLQTLADAENQTAEQQANARAEAAEKAANETVAAANKTLVAAAAQIAALTAGANPARVEALLKLSDLSTVQVTDGTPDAAAVKTAIDAALKDFPEFKKATATVEPGSSGGDLNAPAGTAVPSTLEEALKQRYAK